MLLDSFSCKDLIFQINYDPAFELWDRAGDVARRLTKVWGDLTVHEGKPERQTLIGKNVIVRTGFDSSVIRVSRERARLDTCIPLIAKTCSSWIDALNIERLNKFSSRAIYVRNFEDVDHANKFFRGMNIVRWPEEKVFAQDIDSGLNGAGVSFRFEDKQFISILKFAVEHRKFNANLDPDFVEDPIEGEDVRGLIDFDRSHLASIAAQELSVDEWLRGFVHLLRRDLPKITGDYK